MPKESSIELPLLRVIADAGGALGLHEAIRQVERLFPDLTDEDKSKRYKVSNHPIWSLRVRWARQALIGKGYLYRGPRGIWRITPEGRAYLDQNWPSWQPRYSDAEDQAESVTDETGLAGHAKVEATSSHERRKIPARKARVTRTARRAGPGSSDDLPQPSPGPGPRERPHEQLKVMLSETGAIMGFHPEQEFREPPYVYDVVWRDFPGSPPSRVFKVQDRGNLIEALAKLQHAKDMWRSSLFLVVTGERDRRRLEQLVAPLLAGTFHRIARSLTVLLPDQLEELHGTLQRHRELLQKLLPQ